MRLLSGSGWKLPVVLISLQVGLHGIAAHARVEFTRIAQFRVPEAVQGVAVDDRHFYAVDDRTIARYDKATGARAASWQDHAGELIHLDSAVVWSGRVYAAHSNYRRLPMTSSVEIWDAESLTHVGRHDFGTMLGSLTWLDEHAGFWWGAFANYDRPGPDGRPYGGTANTILAKLDTDFGVLRTWTFPEALLERFEDMSNSGGSWGPDGLLYLTGHDQPEIYRVRVPASGSELELVETIALAIRGQGIAWDRSEPGILYGIVRASPTEKLLGGANRVLVFRSNAADPALRAGAGNAPGAEPAN